MGKHDLVIALGASNRTLYQGINYLVRRQRKTLSRSKADLIYATTYDVSISTSHMALLSGIGSGSCVMRGAFLIRRQFIGVAWHQFGMANLIWAWHQFNLAPEFAWHQFGTNLAPVGDLSELHGTNLVWHF